ncbi:hypothetical protein PY310_05980 [Pseudarthrobacter sp. H3Y2-7]|uniref:hypothetical protein n=1 Tax=Pseudarthrobacter TaxID=1742993 RepID=UPI0023B0BA9F|nr:MULTISPECIES: hypothetical protein [unclassified Pseudarthrobacter]MDE8668132.1 hypothetical protein [Pseudarthrobacter sp. H3Y2-7]
MNDEVTSSEEAVFSRRRVVKGVAWSVPVIVAAVGAPPASASPGPTPTPVPASVKLGALATVALTGATSASATLPTGFDIHTGTAFVGNSVSYTITIRSQASNQKALISIASISPGTGSTSIPQNKKDTTFTSSVATTPGDHTLHVSLSGFKYTEVATKGTFTYDLILTAIIDGVSKQASTTFQATFS